MRSCASAAFSAPFAFRSRSLAPVARRSARLRVHRARAAMRGRSVMARLAAIVFLPLLPMRCGARRLALGGSRGALAGHRPTSPRSIARGIRASFGLLALAAPRLEAQQLELVVDSLDTNGDGVVDKEEFMLGSRDMLDADSEEDKTRRKSVYRHAAALYDACDVDGDGVLNDRELELGEYLSAIFGGEIRPDDAEFVNDFKLGIAEKMLAEVDDNGDRLVDIAEFLAFARRCFADHGWEPALVEDTLPNGRLNAIFEKADITSDGVLCARELQFAAIMLDHFLAYETGSAIYKLLDANSDGRVDRSEVEALRKTKRRGEPSRVDLIHKSFEEGDVDGDGSLDEKELHRLIWDLEWGHLAEGR